jgi:hypothetical protein
MKNKISLRFLSVALMLSAITAIGVIYMWSKALSRLSDEQILWNQNMSGISFLCMQFAHISKKTDQFERLFKAGIEHANPSNFELQKLHKKNDESIPEDIKNIFDILKQYGYDPATFMLASYIKESDQIASRFVTADATSERVEQADAAFKRLSCANIN